jgi:AraC family transcriptional regulator, regulatory protein of adaptative response / methylated-DNA-[protein]-cysteine methyltransferase
MATAASTTGRIDEETAWTALVSRDHRFDGRFVFAVATTRVYCRPSCPARRPRRENVRFFEAPPAAEKAGFRACRRCHPRNPHPAPAAQLAKEARDYLDAHLDGPVTLAELGREVGASPFHLQRVFKRETGLSPREYRDARRHERLRAQLKEGDTVTSATYEAGYGSLSRVYEKTSERLGMTPADYKRGGRGLRIRFGRARSPFGRVLVAATDRGLCAVNLADTDGQAEAALRREFPEADLERGGAAIDGWLAALVRHLEGKEPRLDLPLDVQASAFRWRVYKALQEIPYGETRSYGEVAAALGRPTAARAVARACATNPVALVVPCHRVVRGGGESGGYRWGAARKARLLAREKEMAGGGARR